MKKFFALCLVALLSLGVAVAAPSEKKNKKKTETTVFVTDITCSHCVNKIMNNVPALGRGIKDVQIDLPKKEVTVVYDASKTDSEHIIKGFASLKVNAEVKADAKADVKSETKTEAAAEKK